MAETKAKKDSLTKEEEALMDVVKEEYLNIFFNYPHPKTKEEQEILDKKRKEFALWVYEVAKLPTPVVMVVDSTLAAQFAVNLADRFMDPKLRVKTPDAKFIAISEELMAVMENFKRDVIPELLKEFEGKFPEKPSSEDLWKDLLYCVEYGECKYWSFSSYMNCRDLPWLAYYDYFQRIGIDLENPNFNKYLEFKGLGVYDSIQLDLMCVLVRQPIHINRKLDVLHGEDVPAIGFADDYGLFFWNGVQVPQRLIMSPEKITKEDLLANSNAEVRRAFNEKLGSERYYHLISDGKGLDLLDEDKDGDGNIRKLWKVKAEAEDILKKSLVFVEVSDPSTGRHYTLNPPPNAKVSTCDEAVRATFNGAKYSYRQGDVAFKFVDPSKQTDKPLFET